MQNRLPDEFQDHYTKLALKLVGKLSVDECKTLLPKNPLLVKDASVDYQTIHAFLEMGSKEAAKDEEKLISNLFYRALATRAGIFDTVIRSPDIGCEIGKYLSNKALRACSLVSTGTHRLFAGALKDRGILEMFRFAVSGKHNNINQVLNRYPGFKTNNQMMLNLRLLKHVAHGEQKEAEEIVNANPHLMLNLFLQRVVFGQQKEAEEILKTHPDLLPHLLCTKATVTDYCGRTIKGTALQIALGAEDFKCHDNEECMAEMLQGYLKQLPNGEALMAEQIAEQFPEGWEKEEEKRAERDSKALNKVFDAIGKAQSDHDWDIAIQEFCEYLECENIRKGVIKSGKHFNIQLLVEAFKLYNKNYPDFGNDRDSPKNIKCWSNIIGGIQRCLPAYYAQVFCQSVFHIVKGNEKLFRSMKFRSNTASYFFPLDLDPRNRLGKEYAMDTSCQVEVRVSNPCFVSHLRILCEKKQQHRKNLCGSQPVSRRIGMPY